MFTSIEMSPDCAEILIANPTEMSPNGAEILIAIRCSAGYRVVLLMLLPPRNSNQAGMRSAGESTGKYALLVNCQSAMAERHDKDELGTKALTKEEAVALRDKLLEA